MVDAGAGHDQGKDEENESALRGRKRHGLDSGESCKPYLSRCRSPGLDRARILEAARRRGVAEEAVLAEADVQLADQVIDTSEHTVHTLRRLLIERFGSEVGGATMRVQVRIVGRVKNMDAILA